MKLMIIVCFLLFISSDASAFKFGRLLPPKVEKLANVQSYWFPQILDHYSQTKKLWNQRYFMNDEFWGGPNSPIFLMVGGESEASPAWMQAGAWYQWAYKYKALLFQLEHRYYGQSHPTSDVSVQNLQYLTSQQALADTAYFIYTINTVNNFTSNVKWILFGGSYPGNLVAWARLKYPSYVYGAISSSGPYQAKLNFTEYQDVVRDSLNYYSSGCAGEVTKAAKTVQQLLKTTQGQNTLYKKIQPCSGFDSSKELDRASFVEGLTGSIAVAVQYDKQLPDNSINKVCSYMNDKSVADPLDRLIKYYKSIKNDSCVYSNYNGIIEYYKQTSWDSSPNKDGNRQWIFQTCNEFGYYQTSDTANSFLSDTVPLKYYTDMCYNIFGSQYTTSYIASRVDYTNRFYGGTDINVQRVVFLQGSIDPWHALGMVKNPTNEDPLLYITGTSHCYDMLTPQSYDPQSLKSARTTAEKYLDYWLL